MAKYQLAGLLILLLNLGTLLPSLASDCSNPPSVPKTPSSPSPKPKPPSKQQNCPIDALKLSACVDVLGGLIHVGIGGNPKEKCCPLLQGLADLDAAICLCTAIRLKALNLVNLLVPVSLNVLVNDCGKHVPAGFKCPT